MILNDAVLEGLNAEGARRIRAGATAYVMVLGLPRIEVDGKGGNFFRWRGTEVRKDESLGTEQVVVDP